VRILAANGGPQGAAALLDRIGLMALLHLTTSKSDLRLEGSARDGAAAGVMAALEAAPPGAPVVILIHGYMFDPSPIGRAAGRDPHSLLFGMRAPGAPRPVVNWPRSLGFSPRGAADGLAVGFGWPAHANHLTTLATRRRNGLAEAYLRAGEAGEVLAELIAALHGVRPDLRFDMFAHSLGARVALRAMGAPGVGRLLLLGAAEHASVAEAAAVEAPWVSVYNFISRQNDPFDLMFEWLTNAPAGDRAAALGRAGLGGIPSWIDLQIDNPRLERWLARRGLPLAPHPAPVCHWSFYSRAGAMALYRTLIRDRAGWSIAAMRAGAAPEEIAPRWSRFRSRPFGPGDIGAPTTA
jgi:hypothetical protein